jgi:hypothetical protein
MRRQHRCPPAEGSRLAWPTRWREERQQTKYQHRPIGGGRKHIRCREARQQAKDQLG